jgi:hypothetical protein
VSPACRGLRHGSRRRSPSPPCASFPGPSRWSPAGTAIPELSLRHGRAFWEPAAEPLGDRRMKPASGAEGPSRMMARLSRRAATSSQSYARSETDGSRPGDLTMQRAPTRRPVPSWAYTLDPLGRGTERTGSRSAAREQPRRSWRRARFRRGQTTSPTDDGPPRSDDQCRKGIRFWDLRGCGAGRPMMMPRGVPEGVARTGRTRPVTSGRRHQTAPDQPRGGRGRGRTLNRRLAFPAGSEVLRKRPFRHLANRSPIPRSTLVRHPTQGPPDGGRREHS